jgi:hypothetical protein
MSDFALEFVEDDNILLFITEATFIPQVGDLVDTNDGLEYKVISVKWHLLSRVVVVSVVKVNE